MFGHDDDDDQNDSNMPVTPPDNASAPAPLSPSPLGDISSGDDDTASALLDVPTPDSGSSLSEPGDSVLPDKPDENDAATSSTATPHADDNSVGNSGELMHIKQQALQQLSPLMDHLDQTPEERFRTTMMMIQAADNDKLIQKAYDAALAIPDEKVRAQALLDVINEINYFTQQANGSSSTAA